MTTSGSVTRWLVQLQSGDAEAVAPLWDRYFRRLAGVAREGLRRGPSGAADESDVALSAMHSFFTGIRDGEFADLRGRDELWRILVVIAKRKAVSWLRREYAQKRGGGRIVGDALLSEVMGDEPTPEQTVAAIEELKHLLDLLRREDASLGLIAMRKAEGFTNDEIATQLCVSQRSIQRKLLRIDVLWALDLERRFGDADEGSD